MNKSKHRKQVRKAGRSGAGFRNALTVAAAVASLGASLGVDVDRVFAAQADQIQPVENAQGAADHIKGEANMYKDQFPAGHQKGDATQYKYNLPAVQHKTGVPAEHIKGEANMYKDQLPAVQHKVPAIQKKVDLPAVQHKGEVIQQKGRVPANQIKGEATQLKYERTNANFVKLNNKKLKNGNTFILIGMKPYFRTPGGVQTAAPDGNYEFQDGTKFSIKGGNIVQ